MFTLLAFSTIAIGIQVNDSLSEEFLKICSRAPGKPRVACMVVGKPDTLATFEGERPMPMASTSKVGILITYLRKVEAGKLKPSNLVELHPSDLRPGSDLALLLDPPGVSLDLRNLARLMMTISDNTATDLLLREVGGPREVTQTMRSLGYSSYRLDHSMLQGLLAAVRKSGAVHDSSFTFAKYNAAIQIDQKSEAKALVQFIESQEDSITPVDMVRILCDLEEAKIVKPDSAALALGLMRQARGSSRIRAKLAQTTNRAAVKSGTLIFSQSCVVNDVGIIDLPNGKRLAIACFVHSVPPDSLTAAEQTIADLAKAAYDFFGVRTRNATGSLSFHSSPDAFLSPGASKRKV
ncbi:MAG: serine hydrolase [Armatimonadota bacterium]